MKKFKGIWLTILAVVLSVTMILGMTSVSAFAEGEADAPITTTLVKSVKYGDTNPFEAGVTVTAPSGAPVGQGEKFLEVGAYTVELENGYTYTVSCKLDKDYELRVAHNGADIPTYIKAGESFKLPAASVWVASEDAYVDYDKVDESEASVKCIVEGLNDTEYSVSGNYAGDTEITLETARSYTVHYFCKVKGGKNYISKDFTVVAQKEFKDDTRPTLNLVNVPSTIALNTKVTLPKATATDNYDKNVKVEIKVEEFNSDVTANDGYVAVKHVVPNDDGYGMEVAPDAEDEVFENDYNLSFYPTKATNYRITYTAVDDAGNTAVSKHVYETRATDRTAPVLKSFDEAALPTTWGLESVTNKDGLLEAKAGVIKFPRPEFIDNSGEDVRVVFELRDTVNNNVVIRFENINDMGEDGNTPGSDATYKLESSRPSNGLYPTEDNETVTWTEDGLTLDLNKYTGLESMKNKTVTGRYTARYEARDKVPNTTTKTYNIEIEKTFTDNEAPTINEVMFDDEYLVFTKDEEEFVIPTIEVSDNSDANPKVTYKLYAATKAESADTAETRGEGVEVNGGETAKLVLNESDKATLTVKDVNDVEQTLVFENGEYLVYEVNASDDAGNEAESVNNFGKPVSIASAAEIDFADAGALKMSIDYPTKEGGSDKLTALVPGERVNVGGFTVDADKRDFYGFELSLYTKATDSDEYKAWTTGEMTFQTWWHDGVLYVDKLTFAAPVVKSVKLFVRAYTVSGSSIVGAKEFAVDEPAASKPDISALAWTNEGTVYTNYTIKNRTLASPADLDESKPYVVREITGNGKFGLMGYQFTAYNAGTFSFSEYYNVKGATEGESGGLKLFNNGAKESIKITETETPAWSVQDKMPTYADIDEKTTLPIVVASTDYSNVKVELSATFKKAGSTSANPLKVAATADENDGKDITLESGHYVFTPNEDGEYEFTFTASYGSNNNTVTSVYKVKAGDVVPPAFTVSGDHKSAAVENDTFEFFKIILDEAEDASTTTFTKTLKDAAGNSLYTVSGTGSRYADAAVPVSGDQSAYTFTAVDDYTVEYKVVDKAGNETVITQAIHVSAAKVSSPVSTKIISTILIIVGVLLIAGVILYFVRFRKVKSK